MIVGIAMQQPTNAATELHGGVEHGENVDDDKVAEISFEHQMPPHPMHHHINGGLLSQQVYVNHPSMAHPGMTVLETQFQSLGFRQEEGTASSTEPSSTQTNPNVDEEDHEGDDGEDDPVKLFVGQVRSSLTVFKRSLAGAERIWVSAHVFLRIVEHFLRALVYWMV